MSRRQIQIQKIAVCRAVLPAKALVVLTGMLASCVSVCPAVERVSQRDSFHYQSQQDIFAHGQGAQPFLVDRTGKISTPTATAIPVPRASAYPLPLLSVSAGQPIAELNASTDHLADSDAAAGSTASGQPSITELTDTLQWTILFLTAAVGVVIGIHRFTKHKQQTKQNHRMEYQGSLPVRGQFSMHLVRIVDRNFLVTTDRTGVKTVNALNEWDQFTAPVDLSGDDAFPEPQMNSKFDHHG